MTTLADCPKFGPDDLVAGNRSATETTLPNETIRYKYLIALACCLTVFATQTILFSFGYRLTADDVEAHYFALDTVQGFLAYSSEMAEVSGRLGHYLALPVNMFASFASDWLVARIFFATIFFGSFVAFAILLGRLLRAPNIIVPLSLIYAVCSPLLFSHTPPTSYPLQITLPFLIFLICRIFLIGREDEKSVGIVRVVLVIIITAGSEYAFLFAVGSLIVEHLIRNAGDLRGILRSKLLWVDFATMAVALVPYAYRLAVPASYGGNDPDGIRDIYSVLSVLWLHTWNGTIFAHLGASSALGSWKVLTAASGLAAISAVGLLFMPAGARPHYRTIMVACAGLVIAWLCVMLPPSTNKRLHDWCRVYVCTYTTSRLAYYFIIPAIFIPIIIYFERSALALLTAIVVFFGFSHNWNVSVMMRNYVQPYKAAITSACIINPNEARAGLDPVNNVSMHPWMDRAAYWSRIVAYERAKQGC